MRTDAIIKEDVLNELDWEPSIDATKIGVTCIDGVVTLSGHVNTFAEKLAAERAAKRVYGVRAVVEEIEVKIGGVYKRTDQDIAQAALNNLRWRTNVPDKNIKLKVENGWITLEGTVEWNFQRDAAKNAIKDLAGVRGVTNIIVVKAAIEPKNIKEKIKGAFERSATIDADHVNVRVDGHKVILSGSVQSMAEKKQAEAAAWSAPGVTEVVDNLEIHAVETAF
jgi:osmotically-inducible protein OsmY